MSTATMSTAMMSTASLGMTARRVIGQGSTARASSHLRMTRRGRLVLTLLITLPLIGGAFAMVTNGGSATATDHSSVAPLQYITVQSGESLWQLAAEVSPSSDPRDVVADIAQLNQLSTGDIQVGQRLAIPAKYGH